VRVFVSWSVTEGHHQLWCVVAPRWLHRLARWRERWVGSSSVALPTDVSAEVDRMHQILNGPEVSGMRSWTW